MQHACSVSCNNRTILTVMQILLHDDMILKALFLTHMWSDTFLPSDTQQMYTSYAAPFILDTLSNWLN